MSIIIYRDIMRTSSAEKMPLIKEGCRERKGTAKDVSGKQEIPKVNIQSPCQGGKDQSRSGKSAYRKILGGGNRKEWALKKLPVI